jgi:hypothetical protein
VRRWVLALGVCCAACGSTPTAPINDRAPFDFSGDDPVGDTVAVTPLPPGAGPAVDLVAVSGHVGTDAITLNLDFAQPIAFWSAQAANSLDGFVDFDLDQNASTGVADAAQSAGGSFDLGVELYLDLRDNGLGQIALVDAVKKSFVTVPATISGTRLTITIARTLLGTDDGQFDLGVLIGDRDRPVTDFGPDTGHYTVAHP